MKEGESIMTHGEARRWLEDVGARVLHNPERDGDDRAWATVIHKQATSAGPAQLIVAFGSSLGDLAQTAEQHWNAAWGRSSSVH
jgi:hypothetical protein